MISEQRIIKLAQQNGFDNYQDKVIGFSGIDCTEELVAFANALQAEWIKSLGEPVAFRQTIEVEHKGKKSIEYGYSDFQVMNGDTKLYALPNEEVK